jgi:hypothetical protein
VSFGLPFDADFEGVLHRFVESEGLTVGEAVFVGHNNPQGPLLVVAELRI